MTETNTKETKIVKATPKKTESQEDAQPRVTVKAAVIPQTRNQGAARPARPQAQASERPAARPPMGKPVVNKDLENRTKPPVGKVVVPKEVSERGKTKEETPAPNTAAPVAEAPKTEAPAKEAPAKEVPAKETPKTEAPKAEAPKTAAPKADAPKTEAPKRTERTDRTERTERPARQSRDGQNRDGRGDRQGRGDRPQRQSRDGQQERRGQGSRDGQNGRGEQGGRPQRQGDGRPQRRERNDAPKLERMETKPNQKNTEKRDHHEKERNKFAKLESGSSTGKKNKDRMQQRSLEKASKPKKHNKPKPAVVEEEDIMEELPTGTIAVTVPITVAGFCEQAGISTSQVIMALMKMGIMANINQNIDEDTVLILADELGISVVVAKVEEEGLGEL